MHQVKLRTITPRDLNTVVERLDRGRGEVDRGEHSMNAKIYDEWTGRHSAGLDLTGTDVADRTTLRLRLTAAILREMTGSLLMMTLT